MLHHLTELIGRAPHHEPNRRRQHRVKNNHSDGNSSPETHRGIVAQTA
jgi:hypothetical protein